MPFDIETQLTTVPMMREPEVVEENDVGFFEALPAAGRQYNATYNIAQTFAERFTRPEADPNFNQWEGVEGTIFERYPDSLYGVESWEERELVRGKLHEEEADRDTIAAAGGMGVLASMAAGMLDPIFLVPLGPGGVARSALIGGETVGKSILRGAAVTARAGFVSATAAEMILQANQEIRTMGEGVIDISAATLLSGVLGAALGGLSRGARARLATDTDLILGGSDPVVHMDDLMGDAANGTSNTEIKAAKGFGVPGAVGWMRLNPFTEVITQSRSQATKRIMMGLADQPILVDGYGGGASIDSIVRQWETIKGGLRQIERDLYKTYSKRIKGTRVRRLSRKEFSENAGASQRLGQAEGLTEQGKVVIEPEAAELARHHNTVYQNLANEMIELDLLPESVREKGPNFAAAYLKRRYRVDLILSAADKNFDGSSKFKRKTSVWLRKTMTNEERAVIAKKHKDMDIEDAIDLEIDRSAQSIMDHITGRAPGQNIIDTAGAGDASAFSKRVLDWDDADVLEYLDNDISNLTDHYISTVVPRLELTKFDARATPKLKGGQATHTLANTLQEVREEYAQLRKNVITDSSIKNKDKATEKLLKRESRDMEILEATRDRLLGTYMTGSMFPKLAKGARIARSMNLLAQGGQFALSSVPDIGMTVFKNGLGRTFRTAASATLNPSAMKQSVRENKLSGAVSEFMRDMRFMELADTVGNAEAGGVEGFTHGLASNFGKINLLSQWNHFWKNFAGIVNQARMIDTIDAIAQGKAVSKRDLGDLAQLRIQAPMARRIAAQLAGENGGGRDGSLAWANTVAWTDDGARTAFRAALGQSIDATILTPGVADRPLFMSSEWGKTMFQYKTFSLAATSRLMATGAQKVRAGDLGAMNGLVMMTLLGAMVENSKRVIAGREIEEDPLRWFLSGVDRAGIIGLLSDPMHALDKLGYGLVPGGPLSTRFAARNVMSSLLGPTMGLGETGIGLLAASSQGWEERDVRNAMRLIPYSNLFYWRGLLQALDISLEGEVSEALGIPSKRSN